MRSNGTGLRQITAGPDDDDDPDWSPDGRHLVFDRCCVDRGDKSVARLFVLNVRNGSIRPIADGDHPVWSPDGKLIAYATPLSRSGTAGPSVSLIRPDGTGRRTLPSAPKLVLQDEDFFAENVQPLDWQRRVTHHQH
jgi:Tol biopolymer transport system component